MRRIYNYLKNLFLKVFGVSSCAELGTPKGSPDYEEIGRRNQIESAKFVASVEKARSGFKITTTEPMVYMDPQFHASEVNHMYEMALLYGMLSVKERKAENINEFRGYGGAGSTDWNGGMAYLDALRDAETGTRTHTGEGNLRVDRDLWEEWREAKEAAQANGWRSDVGISGNGTSVGGNVLEAEDGRSITQRMGWGNGNVWSTTTGRHDDSGPLCPSDADCSSSDLFGGSTTPSVPGPGDNYSGSTSDAGTDYSSGSDTTAFDSGRND